MTCAYHGNTATLREIVDFLRRMPSASDAVQSVFAATDVEGKTALEIARSRRAAAGRAELLANFFGGAVWGVFRENANCGDPPGTLPVPSGYPVHFAGA